MHVTLPKPGDSFGPDYRVDCQLHADEVTAVLGVTAHAGGARYALRCFLSPDAKDWAQATERFIHRAHAAELFRDRRIVELYGVREHEGTYFAITEWLEGHSLERYLRERGALPADHALRLLTPCVQALAGAHRAGIIHGDVHPSNIFVCNPSRGKEELARLQNFGYGELFARAQYAKLRGEPLRPNPPDTAASAQADIHAFGVMLYRALTGPASGPSGDSARSIIVSQRATHIPPDVAVIVARALAVQPSERYPSFDDLAEDLARYSRTADMPSALRRRNVQVTVREIPAVTQEDIQRQQLQRPTDPGGWQPSSVDAAYAVVVGAAASSGTRALAAPPPLQIQPARDARADVGQYTWVRHASEIAAIDCLSTSDDAEEPRSSDGWLPRWVGHVSVGIALLVCIAAAVQVVARARTPISTRSAAHSRERARVSAKAPIATRPIDVSSQPAPAAPSAPAPQPAAPKPSTPTPVVAATPAPEPPRRVTAVVPAAALQTPKAPVAAPRPAPPTEPNANKDQALDWMRVR